MRWRGSRCNCGSWFHLILFVASLSMGPCVGVMSTVHLARSYKRVRTMERMEIDMEILDSRVQHLEDEVVRMRNLLFLRGDVRRMEPNENATKDEVVAREGWDGGVGLPGRAWSHVTLSSSKALSAHSHAGNSTWEDPNELLALAEDVARLGEAGVVRSRDGGNRPESVGPDNENIFPPSRGKLMGEAARELRARLDAMDAHVCDASADMLEAMEPEERAATEALKEFAFGGWGGEEGLTKEEATALNQMAICGDRNGVALAYLRQFNFDVDKAKRSMRRSVKWRQDDQVDTIFSRHLEPAVVRKHRSCWPTGFHKEDREGRPVFYDRVGQADMAALLSPPHAMDMDTMVQMYCQNMEARRRYILTKLSREAGKPVDQVVTVLDLSGLSHRHLSGDSLAYIRLISNIFQDNYGGMTCLLLVVNVPWIFSRAWKMVKSLLSEETMDKVKVLGKGEECLKSLEEYIHLQNIPDFLGGPSPSHVGQDDPLWREVDEAVAALGRGQDPFLSSEALAHEVSRLEASWKPKLSGKSRRRKRSTTNSIRKGQKKKKVRTQDLGTEGKGGKKTQKSSRSATGHQEAAIAATRCPAEQEEGDTGKNHCHQSIADLGLLRAIGWSPRPMARPQLQGKRRGAKCLEVGDGDGVVNEEVRGVVVPDNQEEVFLKVAAGKRSGLKVLKQMLRDIQAALAQLIRILVSMVGDMWAQLTQQKKGESRTRSL